MQAPVRNAKRANAARMLSAASTVLCGAAAFGQATVDPSTEPFMTLAPYVLQTSNLEPRIGNEEGGTRAYRPWFESGSWTGDLIEYQITKEGARLLRSDIGGYPRDGEGWRGSEALWSARYAFPDYRHYDQSQELDESWQCAEEDPDYWRERNVFTVSEHTQVALRWDTLTDAQRQALDPVTAADQDSSDRAYASPILNYVRGDRSRERCRGGTYRWRFSLLGAIVNSTPVYVPAGDDGLVVVGANDGMLHGFSAANGREVFGYVPSMLLDKVGALRISPYRPTHFVDGELRYRDIGSRDEPRHIVAGGLGAGAKGLFALDVTSPANPAVLIELSGSEERHMGAASDERIGHIRGRPAIARLRDGASGSRWAVVAGNGYASGAGAQLVIVPLDGRSPEFIAADAVATNGLSAPALVDVTGNGVVDIAYAGDLHGNLWRFDLSDNSVSRLFAAGEHRPITVEPDVARHPGGQPGFMVYFGTGSLLSSRDIRNQDQQAIYGIWDRASGTTVAESRLVTQTLVSETVTWPVPQEQNFCAEEPQLASDATVRFVRNQQQPSWGGENPHLGWRMDLPRAGERLIGRPQIRASRIQFVTTNPYDLIDPQRTREAGSGSWILQLDLATGGNAAQPAALFDLNENCMLEAGDGAPEALRIDGFDIVRGTYPVGVNLGPHHIAQPAFARVRFHEALRSVVDGVYVNALQMRLTDLAAAAAWAPFDVTTDSPYGPAHSDADVSVEPAKAPFGSREFPAASGPIKPFIRADGLGHRVDGHSSGYNRHHGVNYVDFFALEPRRGSLRLDAGAVWFDGGAYQPIAPRTSERELNRVTEVGIGENQRFMVLVTNADLSRENVIQIGCRVWPVYAYQTRMMRALRKPRADMLAELETDGLIFTLEGDYNPIRPAGGSADCDEPTLRITPTERVGTLDALAATLPGCVNNSHLYDGDLKPYLNRDGSFSESTGPEDLYRSNPHVTPNQEGRGYRWRNGALTVQLLAIDELELQGSEHLPEGAGVEGEDLGWGGAYAEAFGVDPDGDLMPLHDGVPEEVGAYATSGLLYELSMFWHWGDMTRFQEEGGGRPVTAACYGASANRAPMIQYETEWFAFGGYRQLIGELAESEALQQEYLSLLARLLSPDEQEVGDALEELMFFLDEHDLADYHRLRHYVPNSSMHDHQLIGIDRGSFGNTALDGTPADVVDIESDLLPSLGPNYRPGRRSWIDLSPE